MIKICQPFIREIDEKIYLVSTIEDEYQNIKEEIYKHVLIRNCIQHHQWQLDGDSLKNFGKNKITVLNDKGKRIEIREWKKIYLSINEIENLIENVNQFIKQYDGYIKTRIKTRDFLHNS